MKNTMRGHGYALKAALERLLRQSLPGRCAFCLGATEKEQGWCLPCYRELGWNRQCCAVCAEPLARAGQTCARCRRESPAFAAAQVPLLYQGAVRELVQDFKFHGSARAGVLLAELWLSAARADDVDALLPVPLHPARARERGFNQARWIACELGTRLGLPVVEGQRRVNTQSQRPLSRRERRANLNGAFWLPGEPLPPRVAIVDDVMTTGATVDALARTARRAGAAHVTVYALARTPGPPA